MRSVASFWCCSALAFLTASQLSAQGTILKNSVLFERKAACWSTSPAVNLRGVSTPLTDNHLFEFGWWYRVAGDTQETALPAPETQQYNGDHSSHYWSDVGGRGLFYATESATVFDYSAGSPNGLVAISLSVYNLSSVTPLTLDIFNLTDLDLQPNGSNDTARLVEWTPNRIIQLNDAGGNFAQYTALANPDITNHYLVRPYGATDVGAVLSDAALSNFDDSGLPFGPADFTAGWQFTMTLPPSGGLSASVYVSVNTGANCYYGFGIFCDGLERGNTSIWSAAVP